MAVNYFLNSIEKYFKDLCSVGGFDDDVSKKSFPESRKEVVRRVDDAELVVALDLEALLDADQRAPVLVGQLYQIRAVHLQLKYMSGRLKILQIAFFTNN